MNWKKRAMLHFVIYTVDMSIAMLGFVLAFGLTVKSWAALILLPLVSRFVFHTVNSAIMDAAARAAAGKEPSRTIPDDRWIKHSDEKSDNMPPGALTSQIDMAQRSMEQWPQSVKDK